MDSEKSKEIFMQLVYGLQSSCWMMLGKVMNPVTGKSEKNLEAAKSTIDTLKMLKNKTQGNLTDAETQMLDSSITQLQVNYVEESSQQNDPKKDSDDSDTADGSDRSDESTNDKKEE